MATGMHPPLILASASPRRREILQALGIQFTVDPSSMAEPPPRAGEKPHLYATQLARKKAAEVRKRHREGLILAADTVVVAGPRVLGKPLSSAEARSMLEKLSGNWHRVITGLCLLDSASGRQRSSFASTRVHFRRLTQAEIAWYLSTEEYCDKAGAYAIQGYAALFVDRIEGCYFNVVGFPVSVFEGLCHKMGHSVRDWM